MFTKIATIVLAAAALVAASPAPKPQDFSSCTAGSPACCNQFVAAGSSDFNAISGILPLVTSGTNAPIAMNCVQIPIIGGSLAGTCTAQAACCSSFTPTDTSYGNIGYNCNPLSTL